MYVRHFWAPSLPRPWCKSRRGFREGAARQHAAFGSTALPYRLSFVPRIGLAMWLLNMAAGADGADGGAGAAGGGAGAAGGGAAVGAAKSPLLRRGLIATIIAKSG